MQETSEDNLTLTKNGLFLLDLNQICSVPQGDRMTECTFVSESRKEEPRDCLDSRSQTQVATDAAVGDQRSHASAHGSSANRHDSAHLHHGSERRSSSTPSGLPDLTHYSLQEMATMRVTFGEKWKGSTFQQVWEQDQGYIWENSMDRRRWTIGSS